MNLNKELTLIRTVLCKRTVGKIKALLTEVDKMPLNACAAAIHPRIIYDKTLAQFDIRKRVFIIVHEYIHIQNEHGSLVAELLDHPVLKGISAKRKQHLLLWAAEIWTNVQTYMLLGFKPTDIELDDADLRTASMGSSSEEWIIPKVKDLIQDKKLSKRICDHMANCYSLQHPHRKTKPKK